MNSNVLVWFGPLLDIKIFEHIAFRYGRINVIGEVYFDTSELSDQTREKVSIDYSVLEIGNNEEYYISNVLEGVSYVSNVTFIGKSVSFDKLDNLGSLNLQTLLDNLNLDDNSEPHFVIANQFLPKNTFELLFSKINEYHDAYFYILIDNRIDHNSRLFKQEVFESLLDKSLQQVKELNLSNFSLLEFSRVNTCISPEKYNELLYVLNGLDQELSYRKDLEERAIKERVRIQENLKECVEQIEVLSKKVDFLDVEKAHLKTFANQMATENLKLLIEISKN